MSFCETKPFATIFRRSVEITCLHVVLQSVLLSPDGSGGSRGLQTVQCLVAAPEGVAETRFVA